MSNIYIQEPPALGKVLLKTTVGDIDLELWTKEAPKACRNFIQLCMEGYYNGTIFHRVVPNFIIQGGDPNGDGTGGESVYGQPFKDEFHSRLRFCRRGLVAMANAGKDDNSSQFFFTLSATPELQNKHTIFGKVTGETIYNVLKLADGEIDRDDRPLYPHKIVGCEVMINPFEDIVPRIKEKSVDTTTEKKKKKEKGVKNFGLLSFGMEAEEEEDQTSEFRGKPKSTHDLLDDPKLSKFTAFDVNDESDIPDVARDEEEVQATVESIRDKLKPKKKNAAKEDVNSDDDIEEYYLGKDKKEARKKQAEEIRGQIRDLKKEMSGKKNKVEVVEDVPVKNDDVDLKESNEIIKQYEVDQEKYKKKMEQIPKKGSSREMWKKAQQRKPWVKKLYENIGIYPDNYTDIKFLEEMRKNINIYNVTFSESVYGSCRITQKLSTCVLFSIVFTYLYNEWCTPEYVFSTSCLFTLFGYFIFLFINYYKVRRKNEECDKLSDQEDARDSDKYYHLKSKKRNSHNNKSYRDSGKKAKLTKSFFTLFVFNDFKTVLIYVFFGYLFSPILHTLTDTVSTDTIFATTIFMMIVHLIFSDYGISVAVVSNSFSINSAIFGSICLASRLSTPFCAFVLLTIAVQAFVLSPVLIKLMWNTNYFMIIFCAAVLVSFVFLWNISKTLFCFFLLAVLFFNVYCPYLFVRWQKYKDNIYGPWDEAVVHDSDDFNDLNL